MSKVSLETAILSENTEMISANYSPAITVISNGMEVSPLEYAAANGKWGSVHHLAAQHVAISSDIPAYHTLALALTAAAANGHTDIVRFFIEQIEEKEGKEGVQKILTPHFLNKALDATATHGHITTARYIVGRLREVDSPDHVNRALTGALQAAIKAGQLQAFSYFSTELAEKLAEALTGEGHLAFREAMKTDLAIADSIATTIRTARGDAGIDIMLAARDYHAAKTVANQSERIEFMKNLTTNEQVKNEIARCAAERPTLQHRLDSYKPGANTGEIATRR